MATTTTMRQTFELELSLSQKSQITTTTITAIMHQTYKSKLNFSQKSQIKTTTTTTKDILIHS